MTDSLVDELLGQLQGQPASDIGRRLGLSPDQISGAIAAALPLLFGALERNASEPQGAEALFDALRKTHAERDPGMLDARPHDDGKGARILSHVFGGRQARAEEALGIATGLGSDGAGQLLRMLAPLVLASLARRLFPEASDASPAVLRDLLAREQERLVDERGEPGGLPGTVPDRRRDGESGVAPR